MTKLNINDAVDIPGGVTVSVEGTSIKVNGKEGSLERRMSHPLIKISIEGNKINLSLKNGTKREKMLLKTYKSHIRNIIKGVSEKFTYKLKVCSSHFPMSVSKESNKVIIRNFLGEKIPRIAYIVDGSDVQIKGQEIIVTSIDKEIAGQTAANIESSTRLTKRDRRRFQDGIFIIEKAGVEI